MLKKNLNFDFSLNPENEKKAYCKVINSLLENDEFHRENIVPENFMESLRNGLIVIRLLLRYDSQCIDFRAVN